MKHIINWLITIEHLAYDFYFLASKLFPYDKEFTTFLELIAEDEAYHYRVMESAAEYILHSNLNLPSSIIIDDSIKKSIEKKLKDHLHLVKNGTMTKEVLIDCIIENEFSEWNDIFIFVINCIKSQEKKFHSAATKIQHHLEHIECYFETTDYGRKQFEKLKNIQNLWKGKILLVDDDESITSLLVAVLKTNYQVESAYNGEEALLKLQQTDYDLIISAIDMPIMDGVELFENGSKIIDNLNNKFIFYTSNLSPEIVNYFKNNSITYLSKPSSIIEIRERVKNILQIT